MIVIHGNQISQVPDAYKRYLMGVYRKRFKLDGTPVRIEFRSDENPFAGKRNPLTPRQARSKKKAAHREHKGKKKRGS
jgi:GTP-binding protein